jgi:hypothetical protein
MTPGYNVFISWSGDRSRVVAHKLREWLPRVVQAARPWMSEADIEKGTRGLDELTKALGSMTVGITCLTNENLNSPWILFEAGALSKTIDDSSRLCTYLLDGLKPQDIKPPLGMFQATRAIKDDTLKLVRTVNLSASVTPIRDEDLLEVFDAMWPSLDKTIQSLPTVANAQHIRRDTGEMIAEILEIVRAQGYRGKSPDLATNRMLPLVGITPVVVRSIIDKVSSQQKFIGELVQHACSWSFGDGILTIYFEPAKSTFAGLVEGRETLAKLSAAASEVMGQKVKVASAIAK